MRKETIFLIVSVFTTTIYSQRNIYAGAQLGINLLRPISDGSLTTQFSATPNILLSTHILNTNHFFLLRNNEIGLGYDYGKTSFQAHTSPGGAGGEYFDYQYKRLFFYVNNYLINIKTFEKPVSLSIGPSLRVGMLHKVTGNYSFYKYLGTHNGFPTYQDTVITIKNVKTFNAGISFSLAFKINKKLIFTQKFTKYIVSEINYSTGARTSLFNFGLLYKLQ